MIGAVQTEVKMIKKPEHINHHGGWVRIGGQDIHLDRGVYKIEYTINDFTLTKTHYEPQVSTSSSNGTSAKQEFKVGDRVKIKHPSNGYYWEGPVIKVNDENSPFPLAITLEDTNHSKNAAVGIEYWADKNMIIEKVKDGQLSLDSFFDELTGEDESWQREYFADGGVIDFRKGSDLYCQCLKPSLKTNSAYGNVFEVCTKCKKERI